jgi:peptide/nickel transport system ATP-binding protein
MKCGKQVDEAILIHETKDKAIAKAKTLTLFKRVGLQDPERIYKSYPHELSGGQIQRIMISMAVACSPKILIADEPTTALDVTIQQDVLRLLKELQREYNMSLIFISHDLGVIKQICDRVLVMQNGVAVEYGNTQQIFENPTDPYTKGLIACRPPLAFKMKKLPTVSDFLNNPKLTTSSFIEAHKTGYKRKEYVEEPILEIKQLSTWYETSKSLFGKKTYVKALNNVDLKVFKGECLGLVGESGSGKSTLSKSIMRIVRARSGTVKYKGEDILSYNDKKLKALRKDIQIVFQNPYASLNPRLTIGFMLLEPLLVHKMKDSKEAAIARVEELLNMVGLSNDYYNRYPHELSGGQRQRVVIARALSLEPEFLICDECVSALDVSVQAQIINLLIDLKNRLNLSLIFISHDLAVVQFISDRVIVMQGGEIVESGYADEIINSPKTDYTKRLIAAIPK